MCFLFQLLYSRACLVLSYTFQLLVLSYTFQLLVEALPKFLCSSFWCDGHPYDCFFEVFIRQII